MLKWTETSEALPPEFLKVLVEFDDGGVDLLSFERGEFHDMNGVRFKPFLVRKWLPIPTPAECEAWERLREAVKTELPAIRDVIRERLLENQSDPGMSVAMQGCFSIFKALGALLKRLGGE